MKKLFILIIVLAACMATCSSAQAQIKWKVKGTVTATDTSYPIMGATVTVVGNASHGTITDETGHFSLYLVYSSSTLRFSMIGYSTQDVPVGNNSVINVALSPDTKTISAPDINKSFFNEEDFIVF